jgi:hypothetical protein
LAIRSIVPKSDRSTRARSFDVPTRVLILGLSAALVENFRQELDQHDVELVAGTDLEGLRAAFADKDVDHVILGGGLDIATRADAVREVFRLSDRATVHMKDQLSGPEGFVPFAEPCCAALPTMSRSRRPMQSCVHSDRNDAGARLPRTDRKTGECSFCRQRRSSPSGHFGRPETRS